MNHLHYTLILKKTQIFLSFILTFSLYLFTQPTFHIDQNRLVISSDQLDISIWSCENQYLEIQVTQHGQTPPLSPFFIHKKPDPSPITPAADNTPNRWQVGLYTIETMPGSCGFTVSQQGKKLFSSQFTLTGDVIQENKNCFDQELFYGIGQGADRFALYRYRVSLSQEAIYGNRASLYIPFFFSSGGDAFYYDAFNQDTISFRDKNSAQVTYSSNQKLIQFYYFHEPLPKNLVSRFYQFSHSHSLLPLWAYGYIQSKFGYENQQEVIDLVNQFTLHKIPVSAIVLDLYWFKHMGDLDYNTQQFPDPLAMDRFLEERNIKLITISEPFYTIDSKNYIPFDNLGLFAKDKEGHTLTWKDWWCFKSEKGAIFNPIAPGADSHLGAQYVHMMEMGTDAFWTDLGEPENVPPGAFFNSLTAHDFHNYYNREWSRLIHQAINQRFPNRRLFILSRSGWTGSAQYGVSTWSGDSTSSYEGLALQITLGINSGLTGFSYWGSDVGGFNSFKEKPERELFIRWLQFGTFCPIFRAHGAQSPREPWIYDNEATQINQSFIETRYRLLPYIYSTAFQTYQNGIPMMRPLLLEHPHDPDPNVTEYANQFYFGDFLLVAPVTSPLKDASAMDVYLPGKQTWYDFFTFKPLPPGLHSIPLSLDRIPVYIKEGAIIPTKENNQEVFILIPSKTPSSFIYYEDDGLTNQFKTGDFQAIQVEMDQQGISFKNVKTPKKVLLKILSTAHGFIPQKISTATPNGPFFCIPLQLKKSATRLQF